jgi:hypothetical protein
MRSWINSAEFVMVCIFSFDSFLKFELSKTQMTLKGTREFLLNPFRFKDSKTNIN